MTSTCSLLRHSRQLLGFVLIGLLLQPPVASADGGGPLVNDYRKTYIATGSFADVRDLLELAITDRGIVINHVSHIGNMLSRTAEDVGSEIEVFGEAEAFEFCSSVFSRKMMEADRHNIVFCPYVIAVYTLPSEANRVYLSYRRPQLVGSEASKQSLREVEGLLDEIIKESLQ